MDIDIQVDNWHIVLTYFSSLLSDCKVAELKARFEALNGYLCVNGMECLMFNGQLDNDNVSDDDDILSDMHAYFFS